MQNRLGDMGQERTNLSPQDDERTIPEFETLARYETAE